MINASRKNIHYTASSQSKPWMHGESSGDSAFHFSLIAFGPIRIPSRTWQTFFTLEAAKCLQEQPQYHDVWDHKGTLCSAWVHVAVTVVGCIAPPSPCTIYYVCLGIIMVEGPWQYLLHKTQLKTPFDLKRFHCQTLFKTCSC